MSSGVDRAGVDRIVNLDVKDATKGDVEDPEINLAAILGAVEGFLRRYLALNDSQYIGMTLWIAHTYVLGATSTTPYLHLTSPEPECGKSRAMECVEALTPNPLYAASITPAVLFRVVQLEAPTLLIDEADNLMG